MDVYRAFASALLGGESDPVPLDETAPVREQRYPYRGRIEGYDDYDKLDVEAAYLARAATVCRLPMVYGERDYQRREEKLLRRVRAGRPRVPVGAANWLRWLYHDGRTFEDAGGVARRLAVLVERIERWEDGGPSGLLVP